MAETVRIIHFNIKYLHTKNSVNISDSLHNEPVITILLLLSITYLTNQVPAYISDFSSHQ